jgi:hypothetical protein
MVQATPWLPTSRADRWCYYQDRWPDSNRSNLTSCRAAAALQARVAEVSALRWRAPVPAATGGR